MHQLQPRAAGRGFRELEGDDALAVLAAAPAVAEPPRRLGGKNAAVDPPCESLRLAREGKTAAGLRPQTAYGQEPAGEQRRLGRRPPDFLRRRFELAFEEDRAGPLWL